MIGFKSRQKATLAIMENMIGFKYKQKATLATMESSMQAAGNKGWEQNL